MKILFILFIVSIFTSCNNEKTLKLATTTSVQNSGLLDILVEEFYTDTNIKINYIAVGSGKALQMGRDGEVDVLIVHSKEQEEKFVQEGHSLGRTPFMYNYFYLVGPKESDNIRNELFISRGDNSGTHVAEINMWNNDLPKNYLETGKGMLDTLLIANEKMGYTLIDNGTWLYNKDKVDLIEVPFNELPKNVYSVHLINPNKNNHINNDQGEIFKNWLLEEDTLNIIENYKINDENLFNVDFNVER